MQSRQERINAFRTIRFSASYSNQREIGIFFSFFFKIFFFFLFKIILFYALSDFDFDSIQIKGCEFVPIEPALSAVQSEV